MELQTGGAVVSFPFSGSTECGNHAWIGRGCPAALKQPNGHQRMDFGTDNPEERSRPNGVESSGVPTGAAAAPALCAAVSTPRAGAAACEVDYAFLDLTSWPGSNPSTHNAARAGRSGHAIFQTSNHSFGICADIIARVCANLLPGRLRARGQSVCEHGSAVDQLHSHRLRRGFSKAIS